MRETDTIAAMATAAGKAAIAVIRISGSRAFAVLTALTKKDGLEPRRATLAWLIDPKSQEKLDQALVLWFPGPQSFTGEDMAEIQTHGGRAAQSAVLAALLDGFGLRLAEPGEFTRRAFDNGKLDLTEVEGLAELIAAETAAQRRQALFQFTGAASEIAHGWRHDLIRCAALLEAAIDFPEEDLPFEALRSARPGLEALRDSIDAHLSGARAAERIQDGLSVAILGPPNAGKSTLLNAIARRDVAIISDLPGTTRDTIEVHMDLGGYPAVLVDTAGLRETSDAIEREGVRRALARGAAADIRLFLVDQRTASKDLDRLGVAFGPTDALLLSKDDAGEAESLLALGLGEGAGWRAGLSVHNGHGVDALLDWLTERAQVLLAPGEASLAASLRQRQELTAAVGALRAALDCGADEIELAAENVRQASRHLGRLLGAVEVDELLEVIFREFCIGK